MNITNQALKFLGLGSVLALVLGFTAATVQAGPAPSARQATTSVSKPAVAAAMACGACKTVSVTEHRFVPGTKVGTAVFTVGSSHQCAMCGGAITTVKGDTVDTMQHNCPMCAAGAASCCTSKS